MPLNPDILAAVTRSSGNLPPDAQVAVANGSTSMPDAIDAAQATAAYGDATNQVNHLQSISKDDQAAAWKAATTAQQQLWVGAGFRDPTQHDRGFFSRAVHDIFGAPAAIANEITKIPVVGDAIGTAGNDVANVGGEALNALGSGVRFTQHVFRMGAYKLMTTSDWSDAWNKTTVGDQTFDPGRLRDVQNQSGFDDNKLELAKAAAGGDDYLTKYLTGLKDQGVSDNEIVDIENQVNDKSFQDVVQKLKDAKISFGRTLIPQSVWDNYRPEAEILSGVGDALYSFMDPYLIAAKVSKVAKIAQYGFKAPEEIGALLDKPAAQAWIKDVSGYLAKEDYSGLANRHPQLNPIMSYLQDSNIKTADQLKAAMQYTKPSDEAVAAGKELDAATAHHQSLLDSLEKDSEGGLIVPPGSEIHGLITQAMQDVGLAKVKSENELKQWMIDNTVANHIATGHGSAINHTVQMTPSLTAKGLQKLTGVSTDTIQTLTGTGKQLVPTMTPLGRVGTDVMQAGRKAIDWATNVGVNVGEGGAQDIVGNTLPDKTIRFVGNTFRKALTLLPDNYSLKVNDPSSVTDIQRFARMYLSSGAADAVVDRWVKAGNDLGIKKNIYTDLLSNTFKAAGIDESSNIYQHYLGSVRDGIRKTVYSANGNDAMKTADGVETGAGLLDHHLTDEWALPSFKDLAADQQRNAYMQFVYKAVNNKPVDLLANTIWKPMQLLRIGFPIRVSLEELLGSAVREGPINVAKSFLAARNLKGVNTVEGPLAGLTNPAVQAVSRYLRELPVAERDSVKSVQDLVAKVHANRTIRYLKDAKVDVPLVGDLENTVRKFPELFEKGLPSEISSLHGGMLGYQAQSAADLVGQSMTESKLNFAPTMKVAPNGQYKEYRAGEMGFMQAWMKQLDDIGHSTNTQHIINNIGQDDVQLRQEVANYLQSNEYRNMWNSSARSSRLSDGRVVGKDANADEAALDWADHLITHVRSLLPQDEAHSQAIIDDLVNHGHVRDMKTLHNVPDEIRPSQVTGPEFVQLPGGKAEGMIREYATRGFHRMGRAIDYMSRQPMYLTAVHKADSQLRPAIEGMFGQSTAMTEQIIHELVRSRAAAETVAYVHNPHIRSQMNILTQNLMPFQFAQEQFIKRWAKTFIQSPEAIRELQLAHSALGATGITHVDDTGTEIFTYPTTGFAQTALTEGLTAMGIPSAIPVVNSFTGQLNMVAPGMDHTFKPSFGPFVSIPLSIMERQVKELQPVGEAVLGPQAQSHSLWEQYLPASVARLINASIANDAINPSYANAQMKAIQDLYANGHGLPTNATPSDREEFMRRVKNFTRINMFARALFGFGSPASPQAAIGDTKFGHQLRIMSNAGLNFSDAMKELVKQNPDMYPYTVFMSEGAGTEPLPATTAAMATLENHRGFFKDFTKAGGYFLPVKSANDTFSNAAYREQLAVELRKRRTPDEFLNQLMYAQASGAYYDTRDQYNTDVKGLHGAARDQLSNQYQSWKAQYLAEHPVFADMLQEATAKTKRADTLAEVQRAINSNDAPQGQQTEDIRGLIDTYAQYQKDMSQYAGMNSARSSQTRQDLTAQFVNWAKNSYLPAHVGATDVYHSLLRADLEGN